MSLNATPSGERVHIGFFGRRNAGKSSVVNAVTGQNLAIVSDVLGTTTDPVLKAMELLPLGPVVIIDTPGIDDEGEFTSCGLLVFPQGRHAQPAQRSRQCHRVGPRLADFADVGKFLDLFRRIFIHVIGLTDR